MTENLTATIRKVRREQVQTSAELAYPTSGLLCRVGIGKRRDGYAVVRLRPMISAIDTK
jgi:hypothetical protein